MRALPFGLAGAAALVAGTAPSLAADTLPVLVKKDVCFEEGLHDRVQGHLLFSYLVGERGRVEQVRPVYVQVSPPELETKLVAALRTCLEGWVYKPATRGGQPSRTGMMTPFHFFRPAPPDDEMVSLYGGKKLGRSRLEEMREAKEALISHLLSGRASREMRGDGWILRTDLGAKDVNTLFEALQIATRAFESAFPGTQPVPADKPVLIVAFRDGLSQAQVDAFDNLQEVQFGRTGKYDADRRMIYLAKADMPTPAFADFLIHETMHHLTSYRLRAGLQFSSWVHEGIAEFLECLNKRGKGEIDFAQFERGRIPGGPDLWRRSAEEHLSALSGAVKDGRLLPLGDLLQAPWQEFAGNAGAKLYAQSWLLVHYLFNAEGGKLRAPFQAWVMQPPREEGPTDLATALGRPIAEIEAALPAYFKAIR
jgi:hypothetical protein